MKNTGLVKKAGIVLLMFTLVSACSTPGEFEPEKVVKTVNPVDYKTEILDWQARRETSLKKPYGWLSLVGLQWLEPGENSIGLATDNDVVLKAGPAHWGNINVFDSGVVFKSASNLVTVDGKPEDEVRLIADVDGQPNIVSAGTTQFYLIKRGSYALRVKDSQSPTRLNFKGLDRYPIDASWKIEGKFIPAKEGETIPISNVLGQLEDSPKAGTLEFEKDGHIYRLDAIDEGEDYFFIVADKTNGHGTYGAGRFIYTGHPQNGRLSIDFNKAYNPPCAFTAYSTCPLPPPQNRLALKITAGEKEYQGKH